MSLSSQKCVPCEGGLEPMGAAEIRRMLEDVPGWEVIAVDGMDRLVKGYEFSNFQAAMDFCVRVGELAEAAGHHPEMTVTWGKASVAWWTHAIAGLHKNDFIMAARTDEVARESAF